MTKASPPSKYSTTIASPLSRSCVYSVMKGNLTCFTQFVFDKSLLAIILCFVLGAYQSLIVCSSIFPGIEVKLNNL